MYENLFNNIFVCQVPKNNVVLAHSILCAEDILLFDRNGN